MKCCIKKILTKPSGFILLFQDSVYTDSSTRLSYLTMHTVPLFVFVLHPTLIQLLIFHLESIIVRYSNIGLFRFIALFVHLCVVRSVVHIVIFHS